MTAYLHSHRADLYLHVDIFYLSHSLHYTSAVVTKQLEMVDLLTVFQHMGSGGQTNKTNSHKPSPTRNCQESRLPVLVSFSSRWWYLPKDSGGGQLAKVEVA